MPSRQLRQNLRIDDIHLIVLGAEYGTIAELLAIFERIEQLLEWETEVDQLLVTLHADLRRKLDAACLLAGFFVYDEVSAVTDRIGKLAPLLLLLLDAHVLSQMELLEERVEWRLLDAGIDDTIRSKLDLGAHIRDLLNAIRSTHNRQ